MPIQQNFNVPNALSFYRILSFPLIMYFIISGKESLFAVFLIINLITDVLDGLIARKFNLETEFGARLDSIADNLTYILAIIGLLVFKMEEFAPHLSSFLIYVSLLVITMLISLFKFKRFPSLHLYSWKIGGYIQGIFLIVLFGYDFVVPLYYLMVIWGILATLEHIILQLYIPRLITNARGLYWVMKNKTN